MILRNIKLSNIRSYRSQSIDFPEGSLLLSGDIGAGKSSILLAAEFALFGIMKGDLGGDDLLRHGAKEGSVELKFEVDGREVIIKRNLKRAKDSTKQDSGFIIIDGKKDDGTHVELKTAVLNLLGYPKELVSKSKSLIYRYTVYTPQEQMKHIIFSDRDERLNILRGVFGIDRYKRVAENTQILLRAMKEKAKELQGYVSDLSEKKKRLMENIAEMKKADEALRSIAPLLEDARARLREKKAEMEKYEKDIAELNRARSMRELCEGRLVEKADTSRRNTKEIELLSAQIGAIRKRMSERILPAKSSADARKALLDREKTLEKELNRLRLEMKEAELRKKNSEDVIEGISSLSSCPTCKQNVPDGHKRSTIERERGAADECMQKMKTLAHELEKKEAEISAIRKDIDRLAEEERKAERARAEHESDEKMLKEKDGRKTDLAGMQEEIKKDVAALNMEKIEHIKRIESLSGSEKIYAEEKRVFDNLRENERKAELEKAKLDERASSIKRTILLYEKEVAEKEKRKAQLERTAQMQQWLESQFLNVVGVIEKNVMHRIHSQFRELFQQWFKALVEDEALSISLDESFTPVVQQDGYEATLDGLSGGEKTAVALAYRLSLNKVINDVVGMIKTKDIIILDEPTDGFSSEQLDKVRDVIEELGMKQVIIVSHEPKVESFVSNIIRIEKAGHVSSIGG